MKSRSVPAVLLAALLLLTLFPLPAAQAAFTEGWNNIRDVQAGYRFAVGLRADGSVVLEEYPGDEEYYEPLPDVSGWSDVVEILVPPYSSMVFGLRADGTVLTAGSEAVAAQTAAWSEIEQLSLSPCALGGLRRDGTVCGVYLFIEDDDNRVPYLEGLKDIVRLFAGPYEVYAQDRAGVLHHGGFISAQKDLVELVYNPDVLLYRYADGTAQLDIPGSAYDFGEGECVKDWRDLTQITASDWLYAGLRSDGTVVACELYGPFPAVDSWRDVTRIRAAFDGVMLGLRADGTLYAAAVDDGALGSFSEQIASWTNIRDLFVTYAYAAALFADGTVETASPYGETRPFDTSDWSNVVRLCGYGEHLIGLRADGTVLAAQGSLFD